MEKKSFECPHCDHTTSNKSDLQIHIRGVHEDKRPFKCMVCDKAFKQDIQ